MYPSLWGRSPQGLAWPERQAWLRGFAEGRFYGRRRSDLACISIREADGLGKSNLKGKKLN